MRLTDADMLRGARRRLREHLALRPATRDEALAIAATYDAAAERAESAAADCERQYRGEVAYRTFASAVQVVTSRDGRRDHTWFAKSDGWIERGHGPLATQALQEASLMRWAANRERSHADAWRRVADAPEGEVFAQTERELRERVDYYVAKVHGARADAAPR
jgi:hypothetical protein